MHKSDVTHGISTTDIATLDHDFAPDEPEIAGKFLEFGNDGMVRIQQGISINNKRFCLPDVVFVQPVKWE
jgi:hypothetical protein